MASTRDLFQGSSTSRKVKVTGKGHNFGLCFCSARKHYINPWNKYKQEKSQFMFTSMVHNVGKGHILRTSNKCTTQEFPSISRTCLKPINFQYVSSLKKLGNNLLHIILTVHSKSKDMWRN